jgi:ATP-dependent DNA helicase RecG
MAIAVLHALAAEPAGKAAIAKSLGKTGRTRYLSDLMKRLLNDHFVEYTIPDKPSSRLQKYRLTDKGRARLKKS